jgi:protein-disulfide isomerase
MIRHGLFRFIITVLGILAVVYFASGVLEVGGATRARAPVQNWQEINALGVNVGPEDARVTVTEFLDFTCHHCQEMASVLDSLRVRVPDVKYVFHYWEIGQPLSLPSAVAAECAERQGRFWEMYKAIFGDHRSLGVRSWADFAAEAGIADMAEYNRCVELPVDSFPRIVRSGDIAASVGVRGIPTVLINGIPFSGKSLSEFLEEIR